MKNVLAWLTNPPTDGLRLMAGSVFFWEGILKFVYANQGIGRFRLCLFPQCRPREECGPCCTRSVPSTCNC